MGTLSSMFQRLYLLYPKDVKLYLLCLWNIKDTKMSGISEVCGDPSRPYFLDKLCFRQIEGILKVPRISLDRTRTEAEILPALCRLILIVEVGSHIITR